MRDIPGSRLTLLGYYRDFLSRYTPFDARGIATRGRNVDQVTQNHPVLGGRLTIETPLAERTSLARGGDLARERSAAASSPMTGYRVPPLKVTAYVGATPVDRLDKRFQGLLSGDRDDRLDGVQCFGRRKVEQYAGFGVTGRWRVTGRDIVTAGIEDLFDTRYFPGTASCCAATSTAAAFPPTVPR